MDFIKWPSVMRQNVGENVTVNMGQEFLHIYWDGALTSRWCGFSDSICQVQQV